MRQVAPLLLGLAMLGASGCATIVDGTSESITVSTTPAHARCALTRGNETIGVIADTPGTAKVDRTKESILVACSKDGYRTAGADDKSGSDAWVYGNFAIGLVGFGVDFATGAHNKYASSVAVALTQYRTFGVGVSALDPNSLPAAGPVLDHGVKVMVVQGGSAAANSGIAPGDILVSIDGEPLSRKGDIQRVVGNRPEGSIVSVHLVRNGAPMDLATQL